jgi:hypothetical protein
MGNLTFEHKYVNAGLDYLSATDQTLATATDVSSSGYSIWATPRLPFESGASWELLLRRDHWTPNTALDSQKQNRTIVGVSYWFPHQGNVSTAILFDYDGQSFDNIATAPTKGFGIHGLLNF